MTGIPVAVGRGRPYPETTAQPSWRDRLRALRYIPKLVRLVWETHRGLTLAMGALRLIRSFVPIAALYVGKLIIDGVVAAQKAGSGWRSLLNLVLLEIAIVAARRFLELLIGEPDRL